MPHFHALGTVSPKRHTQFRRSDGTLYYEEMIGEEGFSSESTLLYHRNIPSAVSESRIWDLPDLSTRPNHPLKPLHLRLHTLFEDESVIRDADPVTGRRLVLGNSDVRISYVVAQKDSPLYRNAMGDECIYIESGSGVLESVFGSLAVSKGDFVVIPRSTIHRWTVDVGVTLRAYCIEANGHVNVPKRYLSSRGQFLENSPFCERDLNLPAELIETTDEPGAYEVYTKHRGNGDSGVIGSIVVAPFHPFDVVGWAGCLYPYTFNVKDFEPITGRVHQPPPVHQVFEGGNFVICAFVPRMADYHPLSIPVPYYHANVDSDEIMFYCGGDYEARKGSGIAVGSVSVHPAGHSHGPQPGAMEGAIGKTFLDELAVMVDTFKPLELGEGAVASDDGVYVLSWAEGLKRTPVDA